MPRVRFFLLSLSLLASLSAIAGPVGPVTPVTSVQEENGPLLHWLDRQQSKLAPWLSKRGMPDGPPEYLDFRLDPKLPSAPARTAAQEHQARETKALYNHYFPASDPSSHVATFFEGGHPYIETKRGPYQWNSMKVSGMEDPELFKKAVDALTKRGIKSIRIAPNLHELDTKDPKSFDKFISQLDTIWAAGGTPTIAVAFFPSLKKWQVKDPATGEINYDKSYLQHSDFPSDMGELTEALMKRVWKRADEIKQKTGADPRVVINAINEPETLAAFGVHFWHWPAEMRGIPETRKFYVASTLQIGKANVEIRRAVEKTSGGRRILFMHNEAMTPHYYPSHSGGGRFAVSKFMLGDDVVMKKDFDSILAEPLEGLRTRLEKLAKSGKIDETEWAIREYVFGSWNKTPASQETARREIVRSFVELKMGHLSFAKETGKTLKSDVMLLLDYYYQTEFKLTRPAEALAKELSTLTRLKEIIATESEEEIVRIFRLAGAKNFDLSTLHHPGKVETLLSQDNYKVLSELIGLRSEAPGEFTLGFEPQHAARQMRLEIREGLASFLMTYFKGIGLFVGGVGETGTPFYTYAAPLHEQMLMDLAAVLRAGNIYGTQYAFGPAVDTRGWTKAPLGLHYADDHAVSPSGLLSVEGGRTKKVTERQWVGWFVEPLLQSARDYQTKKKCVSLLDVAS